MLKPQLNEIPADLKSATAVLDNYFIYIYILCEYLPNFTMLENARLLELV